MAENIPGIYNICDRWCERCIYQDRCKVFEDEEKMEKELDERGITDPEERFFEQMKDTFKKTSEMLDEVIGNNHFNIDDEELDEDYDFDEDLDIDEEDELSAIEEQTFEEENELQSLEELEDELLQDFKIMGDNLLSTAIEVVDEILDELEDSNLDFIRESAIAGKTNTQKLVLEVSAAIDIIKWHATFIPSKVNRLKMELEDEDYEEVTLNFDGVEYLMVDLTARLLYTSLIEMHDALITVYDNTTLATNNIAILVKETDQLIDSVKELCPGVEDYKRPYFD